MEAKKNKNLTTRLALCTSAYYPLPHDDPVFDSFDLSHIFHTYLQSMQFHFILQFFKDNNLFNSSFIVYSSCDATKGESCLYHITNAKAVVVPPVK